MGKDIPAVTGNDRAVCGPSGLYIIERVLTPKEIKAIRVNAALEKFSTKNIAEPTPDHKEYEVRGLTNIEAGIVHDIREGARGNSAAHERTLNRIEGPVEQRTLNANINMTLDDFLDREELNDATDMELEEAGIVIDVTAEEVRQTDEEDYVADM